MLWDTYAKNLYSTMNLPMFNRSCNYNGNGGYTVTEVTLLI